MSEIEINLAPITLFVYNRPEHTKKTIEALQKNELANESELFIYSDAAKNKEEEAKVKKVREYINNIDGFKKITILKKKINWGLTNSIIDGVTEIINKYGKIIVLEDDLVTSKYFLRYMNDALKVYKDNKRVWEIGGYVYPISYQSKKDFFFAPYTTSWGWATWINRWKYYERNPKKLINSFDEIKIKKFNLDNSDEIWEQVIQNAKGKLYTWAVFWYAVVFLKDGVTVYPKISMVKNIGHDGSGMNSGKSYIFETKLSEEPLSISLEDVEINSDIITQVKKYLRKNNSFLKKFLSKFRKLFI